MASNRRTFLTSLGASLAAPLLAGRAQAQARGARRLIVFYSPDGVIPSRWRPTGGGTDFDFPIGSMLEPLRRWRGQLTVVGGLHYEGAISHDRGMIFMLTNSGWEIIPEDSKTDGKSIDQYVATQFRNVTRFPSLELGVQTSLLGAMMISRMCYAAPQHWVTPNDDPADVHQRIFGRVEVEPPELSRNRRSVLDLLREDIRDLDGRLPTAERRKLAMHLDALRDVERSIEPLPPELSCRHAPALEAHPAYDNDAFPTIGRNQMDLMVAALACDLTRVASIQWSMASSTTLFSWLGHREDHHSLSHADVSSPGLQADFLQNSRWYAEQFAYLLDRLHSLPEPGASGSMLDHSVVLWTTEIGDGVTHICEDMPIIVAGGGSGRLRPGRYLRFDGRPHGHLLTSLCHAMGLEVDSFGNPASSTGPLEGLVV